MDERQRAKQLLQDGVELMKHFASLVEKDHSEWAHTARAWARGAEGIVAELK